jgi:hypothetical protein
VGPPGSAAEHAHRKPRAPRVGRSRRRPRRISSRSRGQLCASSLEAAARCRSPSAPDDHAHARRHGLPCERDRASDAHLAGAVKRSRARGAAHRRPGRPRAARGAPRARSASRSGARPLRRVVTFGMSACSVGHGHAAGLRPSRNVGRPPRCRRARGHARLHAEIGLVSPSGSGRAEAGRAARPPAQTEPSIARAHRAVARDAGRRGGRGHAQASA